MMSLWRLFTVAFSHIKAAVRLEWRKDCSHSLTASHWAEEKLSRAVLLCGWSTFLTTYEGGDTLLSNLNQSYPLSFKAAWKRKAVT